MCFLLSQHNIRYYNVDGYKHELSLYVYIYEIHGFSFSPKSSPIRNTVFAGVSCRKIHKNHLRSNSIESKISAAFAGASNLLLLSQPNYVVCPFSGGLR